MWNAISYTISDCKHILQSLKYKYLFKLSGTSAKPNSYQSFVTHRTELCIAGSLAVTWKRGKPLNKRYVESGNRRGFEFLAAII